MYQVGDHVSFSITPTPSTGSLIYSYVWKFWDGTVLATTVPFTPCIEINIGGKPGAGNLNYSVTPVQIDGQHTTLSGTILANNPPRIFPSPTVSANDSFFPFQTELSVIAFDFEGQSFEFQWFSGVTLLGAGVSTYVGAVTGTWMGNGTTVISQYSGTRNTFDTTVSSDQTLTCVITDSGTGVTTLDFPLRGFPAPPPQVGVSGAISGLTAEASDLPQQRIGQGQSVTFSVYGKDVNGSAPSFLWTFAGSNNWTTGPIYTTGVVTALPDGGFQSTYEKDISGEVVSFGTEKVVIAVATVVGSTSQTEVQQPITLIANSPPDVVHFTVKNNGTEISAGDDSVSGDSFPPGTQFEFDAVAPDPNSDIIEYFWQFEQPSGVSPSTLNLWGAKVFVDTAQYPTASLVQGILTVTDRMGGTFVTQTPFITIL